MGIFALALRKNVKNPFAPESDEVTTGKQEEEGKKEKAKSAKLQPVKIDFQGLGERAGLLGAARLALDPEGE